MNQRVFSEDYVCMPPKEDARKVPKEKEPEVQTEEIIFDKAIMAQMLDRIYTIADKLPARRKDMEDKIKEIADENIRDELKEQIGILAKMEENINPEIQALKDLPDITSLPDDKDDEYVEKLVSAEKDITILDNRHEDLEKKIFKALEQE
jgi:predicted  nucleic acid-binding Zn-ribbon protein